MRKLLIAVNDNKVNSEISQLIDLCKQMYALTGTHAFTDGIYGWYSLIKDHRSVANFIWFVKFEISFHFKSVEQRRSEMKVVE